MTLKYNRVVNDETNEIQAKRRSFSRWNDKNLKKDLMNNHRSDRSVKMNNHLPQQSPMLIRQLIKEMIRSKKLVQIKMVGVTIEGIFKNVSNNQVSILTSNGLQFYSLFDIQAIN